MSDERGIAAMAEETLRALRASATQPQAAAKPAPEDAGLWDRLIGRATAHAQSADYLAVTQSVLASRQPLVDKIHADLQAAGVKWETLRLLAFGGVLARVTDPVSKQEDVRAVTGNLYIAGGDKVFALEMSGERIGGHYAATGLWQCVPLNAKADDEAALRKHADDAYKAFQRESQGGSGNAPASARIASPRPVFIRL